MQEIPKDVDLGHRSVHLRLMTWEDGPGLLQFAQALPSHDILFLRRDITKQSGIDSWVRDMGEGNSHTVLAESGGQLLGYGSLYRTDFDWTRHVAELRALVVPELRELGVGRLLIREAFNMALNLDIEKVFARMTLDQVGARTVLEELGFRPEALLKDEVKDRVGKLHDVLVMSTQVEAFLARRETLGLPG